MTKHIFLSILIGFLGSSAFAGGAVGNGGDVLVCQNMEEPWKYSYEVLDYYEAKLLRGIEVELPSGNSAEEIALKALKNLEKISFVRAGEYRSSIRHFREETRFVSGVKLVDIPDSNHLALPENCKLEQLVIQQDPQFPEDKRYLIDQDLWDKLDTQTQAGMILHEVIYREALNYGHQDSRATRYFHSKILSKEMANFTQENYFDLLVSVKFRTFDVDGVIADIDEDKERNESCYDFYDGKIFSIHVDYVGSTVRGPGIRNSIQKDIKFFLSPSGFHAIFFKRNQTGQVFKQVTFQASNGFDTVAVFGKHLSTLNPDFDSVVESFEDGSIALTNVTRYVDPIGVVREGDFVLNPDGTVRQ